MDQQTRSRVLGQPEHAVRNLGSEPAWPERLVHPVLKAQVPNSLEVSKVAGNQRRAVCQGNAGDEQVHVTDLLHRPLASQAIELSGCEVVEQHDHQRIEQLLGPTKKVLGSQELLAVGRLQEEVATPPQNLGLGDDRYCNVRVVALAKPLDHPRMTVVKVSQRVGIQQVH